jgi:hypothetical protein
MSAVDTNAEAVKEASKRIQVRIRGCRLTVWVDGEPASRTDEFGRGVWERKRGVCDRPELGAFRWRQIVDGNVRLGRAELRRPAVMSVACRSIRPEHENGNAPYCKATVAFTSAL